VLILPARPTDANAIAEIHVATWRIAYRGQIPATVLDALDVSSCAEFWREKLSAAHRIFVAELGSLTTGFCSLIPSRDDDADCSIVAENLPARRFYEAHGFQIERQTDGAANDERQPDILYRWSRPHFPNDRID
jgi:hypothetical protein